MAEASKRASVLTTLVIGKVKVGVGLFSTVAAPSKLAQFETAGPGGGALKFREDAAAAPLSSDTPIPEPSASRRDAFADESREEVAERGRSAPSMVPGEYKRVLVEEETGEVVPPEKVRRGVRQEDGTFVDLTDHLRVVEEETKLDKMAVVDFIDVGQIERARVEASYYIGAQESKDARALKLVYEAMRLKRRVAVVKWTTRSRQSLGVLTAHGRSGTLVLLKLAWSEDFREAPAKALSVANTAVSPEQVDVACRLVEAMSGTVASLDELRDDAIVSRELLRERAQAGMVEPVEVPMQAEEVDLDDAFAASLEELAVAGKR